MTRTAPRPAAGYAVSAVAAAALAITLVAACSSSGAGASSGPTSGSASGSTQPTRPGTGTGRVAGNFGAAASGAIAAISGHTLQVQSSTEQTAVTYTAKTAFTAQRSTTLAAIKVGSCIVATSAAASGTGSSTSAAPSAPLTAATVELQTGTCAAGYADCDSNKLSNGCETETQSNPNACGGCNVVCSGNNISNRTCGSGQCNGTCAAG